MLLLDEEAEDLENVIYLTSGSEIRKIFHNSLIISIGKSAVSSDNYIELLSGNITRVFNLLSASLFHFSKLKDMLSVQSNCQNIIDTASSILKVPFFYFDGSYRILAISSDVDFPADEEWKHMKNNRFLSPASAKLMQEAGDMDMLAKARTPVKYKADFFPFTSFVCNIFYKGHFHSRLNRLCTDGNTSLIALEECNIIADALTKLLERDGTQPYESPFSSMLYDLLNGAQLPESLIQDRLSSRPGTAGTICRVICMNVRSSDIQVYHYYADLLIRILSSRNCFVFVYDSHIVLIQHAEAESDFAEYDSSISEFAEKYSISCGVSLPFHVFSTLRGHYLQALYAVEHAAYKSTCFFRDIVLDYSASFIPSDQLRLLISPDILYLKRSEKDYSFPLVETLKTYLECNCSLLTAADRLFVHKNTMLYRLNIIKSIIRADINNAYDRTYLLYSFMLLDKCPDI